MTNQGNGKLLDAVRRVMRLQHDSIPTERAYSEWIKRFVLPLHDPG